MNIDQLNRANEIVSEIRQLDEQLANWHKADKIKAYNLQLSTADDYSNFNVRTNLVII